MKSVHWLLVGELLHLVQRGGDWARGPSPPSHLLAVPSVTAHPSTASVPITVLLYNGPLLCGFNAPIKGLPWLITQQFNGNATDSEQRRVKLHLIVSRSALHRTHKNTCLLFSRMPSRKIHKFERKFHSILRTECWFYMSKTICLSFKYSLLTAM